MSVNPQRPPRNKKLEAAIAIPILALMGAFAVAVAFADGSTDEMDRSPELDNAAAEIACQDYVSDRLTAPASAVFTNTTVMPSALDEFTVAGSVDAQNSFGATIRNSYSCTIQLDGELWTLVSLDGLDE